MNSKLKSESQRRNLRSQIVAIIVNKSRQRNYPLLELPLGAEGTRTSHLTCIPYLQQLRRIAGNAAERDQGASSPFSTKKTTPDTVTCCLKPLRLPGVLRIEYKCLQDLVPASLASSAAPSSSVSNFHWAPQVFSVTQQTEEKGTPSRGNWGYKGPEADRGAVERGS